MHLKSISHSSKNAQSTQDLLESPKPGGVINNVNNVSAPMDEDSNRMLTYPPLVPLPRNMSELPKSAEICRQLSFFAFLVSLYIL